MIARGNELADHLELLITNGRAQEFTTLADDIKEKTTKAQKPKKKKEETLKDYAEVDVSPQIEQQIPTKKVTMESFFLTKTAQKIMNKGKGHVA